MKRSELILACFIITLFLFATVLSSYADIIYVTNTNDSGPHSLRWAIEKANAHKRWDMIRFQIPTPTPEPPVIYPLTALPAITDNETTVDGSSQPGIVLDGSHCMEKQADGLKIVGVKNCNINGLSIRYFDGNGIVVATDVAGVADTPTENNIIGGKIVEFRNVIYENGKNGVEIYDVGGLGTNNNLVSGNYIGTNESGTGPMGNLGHGVYIHHGGVSGSEARSNTVQSNVISANGLCGVAIEGPRASDNIVSGNRIGIGVEPSVLPVEMGNSFDGVRIEGGAQLNTIGPRNTISGNDYSGVVINGLGTDENTVLGNFIGTNAAGTNSLRNELHGVCIQDGAKSNTIGGTTRTARNIISGNGGRGVNIWGQGTDSNVVLGNLIGTDVTGTRDLGNSRCGVGIWSGAQSNVIGGEGEGEGNLISGNGANGVRIVDPGTARNEVSGNYIGTDAAGTAALGNDEYGVYVHDGAQLNRVGSGNVVSGNHMCGVAISGSEANGNSVYGNYIGTDAAGDKNLGNSGCGVTIRDGAQSNVVGAVIGAGDENGSHVEGGAEPGAVDSVSRGDNIISGNKESGVVISGPTTMNNIVGANFIGINAAGNAPLGNGKHGVYIYDRAGSNSIEFNVISGNDGSGVTIAGVRTDRNVVWANRIGIGVGIVGISDMGNLGDGVRIQEGARDNTIGGANSISRNVISGNKENGIVIRDPGTDSNKVLGNFIGTNETGTAAVGNVGHGISISNGTQANIIGGMDIREGNVISGNGMCGIDISGPETNNIAVSGNFIGTDVTGTKALGNSEDGVAIRDGTQSNVIGAPIGEVGKDGVHSKEGAQSDSIDNPVPGEGNVISGNKKNGVVISGPGTKYNTVSVSYIGIDAAGRAALGNGGHGVHIHTEAQSNSLEMNVILGNGGCGVNISGLGTDGNVLWANTIGMGDDPAVEPPGMGNSEDGVRIEQQARSSKLTENRIIGNLRDGVHIEGGASFNGIRCNTIASNGEGNVGSGVTVDGGNTRSNTILCNQIYDNDGLLPYGLGIDLVDGGNDGILPPVIESAVLWDSILRVKGHLQGIQEATVEVFQADSFESGEGKTKLGTFEVIGGTFSEDVDGSLVSIGDPVVATATDSEGNTSEFSEPVAVQGLTPEGWFISLTTPVHPPTNGAPLTFIMGAHPDALNGFDPMDVPLPPMPEEPPVDAYIEGIPPFDRLLEDYREEVPHDEFNQEWRFHASSEEAEFKVCWNTANLPDDLDATILLLPDGPSLNMRSQSCFDDPFPPGKYVFEVHIAQVAATEIMLFHGWNLISAPGDPMTPYIPDLVAGLPVAPYAYTYDPFSGGYKMVYRIWFGSAFWIVAFEDCILTMECLPRYILKREVYTGWNMVGSVARDVPVSNIETIPPDSVLPYIHTWDARGYSYVLVDTIKGGVGHWMAAIRDCTVIIDGSTTGVPILAPASQNTARPSWKSVIAIRTQSLSQHRELVFGMHPFASGGLDRLLDRPSPPAPAGTIGVLNAGWVIENSSFSLLNESFVRDNSHASWGLSVELPEPGELTWSDLPTAYRCLLKHDGQVMKMHGESSIYLPAGKHYLTLVLDAFATLPSRPQLLQSYPNPFNPDTWIPYQLAEDADVTIRVYDAAGHLARTLNLGDKPAGFYTTKEKAAYWDGRNEAGEHVASGIYFYTIQAGEFTATRKMAVKR